MKYQAVLFDFDGTLANDLSLYMKAYDYALKKHNIHLSLEEISRSCFGHTEEAITAHYHLPSVNEFRNDYFDGIKNFFGDISLFPNAIETLKHLKKENIKLGLISFAFRWYIDSMVERTKLRDYFDIIITFNDVKKPKPDPESVMVASKKLDARVEKILLLGDTRGDILMGKAAGCDTALFLPKDNQDYYNFNELRKLNPTYEFTNYKGFLNLLS